MKTVPHLEFTEVISVHLILLAIIINLYTRVLYTCISNKSFGQLLDISRKNFMLVKTFNSEFSYIEVWFTNQFSKPLEIENKINNTLVII